MRDVTTVVAAGGTFESFVVVGFLGVVDGWPECVAFIVEPNGGCSCCAAAFGRRSVGYVCVDVASNYKEAC